MVPWAAEKISLHKKPASSLQNHKIQGQTAALQIKRRYELHPDTQTPSQRTPHTLYFYPSSDTPRSPALSWNVCASAVRSCPCGLPCLRAALTASSASVPAYFFSLALVAAHLRRVLSVSAMSLFARSRFFLLCGCVFFALFKPYGVPPPRSAAECLHTPCSGTSLQQRGILTTGETNSHDTHSQGSLCVVHTCVAQQYSCVFACVGYASVFEPAVLPHLPPAFLRYKSHIVNYKYQQRSLERSEIRRAHG